MVEAEKRVEAWNVVFMSRSERSWHDLICHPDYRHVCAFGYSDDDKWVLVNPTYDHTIVAVLDDREIGQWLAEHDHVITDILTIDTEQARGWRTRLGYWCTTSVKRLLGSNSGALRPQALRRDLLRKGAVRRFRSHGNAGCRQ